MKLKSKNGVGSERGWGAGQAGTSAQLIGGLVGRGVSCLVAHGAGLGEQVPRSAEAAIPTSLYVIPLSVTAKKQAGAKGGPRAPTALVLCQPLLPRDERRGLEPPS